MEGIVEDADAADRAFHAAVDGDQEGKALAEFAEGTAPDGEIARLVKREETTAHAAIAARAATPKMNERYDELQEAIRSAKRRTKREVELVVVLPKVLH